MSITLSIQTLFNHTNDSINSHRLVIRWKGRIITFFCQLAKALYALAIKIIEFTMSKITSRQRVYSSQQKNVDQTISKDRVGVSKPINNVDFLRNEPEPSLSIVDAVFNQFNFIGNWLDIINQANIYDSKGNQFPSVNLTNLQGRYQIKWPLAIDSEYLIFCGEIYKGFFEGRGTMTVQKADGTVELLLDGIFAQGAFVNGLVIFEKRRMEGKFNGQFQGYGSISSMDITSSEPEYIGFFKNGLPEGDGKTFFIVDDHIEVMMDGKFSQGQLIEGRYKLNDTIYEGTFTINENNQLLLQGNAKITNYVTGLTYIGEVCDNRYHGLGQLTCNEIHTYDKLVKDSVNNQYELLEDQEGTFLAKYSGIFKEGRLYCGDIEMKWPDGNESFIEVNNFEITKTIIHSTGGFIYDGKFEIARLNGNGIIQNVQNDLLYQGDIRCGLAHGNGCQFLPNGVIKIGYFEWNSFINHLSQKDEP